MQMQYIGMCCIYCTKCWILVRRLGGGFSPVEFDAVAKAKGLLIKSAQLTLSS